MITCVVHHVIDPSKTEAFERFAQRWMELVDRHGGIHHGYFLPAEGAGDAALALFSVPSPAAYETYRARFGDDPEFVEADRIRDESGCVLRHDRTFMRPLLPWDRLRDRGSAIRGGTRRAPVARCPTGRAPRAGRAVRYLSAITP